MPRRTVHYSIWLKKQLAIASGNVIVVVGERCDHEMVKYLVQGGPGCDVMVITSGGSGIPAWFKPSHVIWDETFKYEFSNAIWFDAVVAPGLRGSGAMLYWGP